MSPWNNKTHTHIPKYQSARYNSHLASPLRPLGEPKQGSALCPILYNLYTADLPVRDKPSTVFTKADSTAILSASRKFERNVEHLNDTSQGYMNWPGKWKV